ncbi:MAG: HAD hydrolase-like protein, partial [Bacilli bacterium]
LKALDIMGLKQENVIVVEDSNPGIIAANKAGYKVIAIPSVPLLPTSIKSAYQVISNFNELTTMFNYSSNLNNVVEN